MKSGGSLPFRVIRDPDVAAALDYPSLVAAMVGAFIDPPLAPRRSVAEVHDPGGGTRTVLAMPAIRPGGIATTKLVTVITGPHQGVQSQLLAFGGDGLLVAMVDGHSLTARRTAAASVLASRAAGVTKVRAIAVLGAGRQARAQAEAYCACFDVQEVKIWARRPEAAEAMASELSGVAARVTIAATAADAAMDVDVITAATMATSPLLTSEDVRPGTHVDLVGGFRLGMREVDDALVARATVIADGPAALEEAGDLAMPLSTGNLRRSDINLLGQVLAQPDSLVRRGDITLFKSVGHAAEDLVATELLLQRLTVNLGAAA
jgi:ornithine cyclodeaminase